MGYLAGSNLAMEIYLAGCNNTFLLDLVTNSLALLGYHMSFS